MAGSTIPAVSSELTEEDLRKHAMVKDLMHSQNKVIADFAKHLVTVSFSAIGIVLALKDKWLGTNAPSYQELLLGIAIALFLVTGLVATLAVSAHILRVSLSDYADIDVELHRVARLRYRLTILGFGLSLVATIIVATVAL